MQDNQQDLFTQLDIPINSEEELRREVIRRAQAQGLRVDCPPSGNFNSRFAIVAEHPGENEVRLKTPLIGASGRQLFDIIKRHKYERNQFYTTNAIKRIVVHDITGKKSDLGKDELQHWKELLLWELSKLPNLKYVLVCGGPALQCLTPHTSIEQWRGSIEQRNDKWFVYTYNPAAIMRQPLLEPILHLDIHKFFAVVEGRYRPYTIKPHINPSPTEAINHVTKLLDESRGKNAKPIAFDIETIAGETACIGLTNDDYRGMCINFRTRSTHTYSVSEEMDIRRAIARLFSDPAVKLVAQNGCFDSYWLWFKDRLRVRRVWFDTMLAHHTLYTRLPHSLAFLVSTYTYHPYYKDEKDAWRENNTDINSFWEYNVRDICLTLHVHRHLHRELHAQRLETFFFNHVMRLQPHLVEMTVNGVLADASLKARLSRDLHKEVTELENKFYNAVHIATKDDNYNPNPRSPAQLRDLFFKRLQLTGRGYSTNEENRKRMLDHPRTPGSAREVIQTLDSYIEKQKFLSTFVDMTIDDDGRIRCEYSQTGVARAPGRLSSRATMWGSGTNLQNQPESAKPMYIADDGWCFVYFDMSQIEARIVGWRAVIPKWMEQFERARVDGSYDAHRALASEMWHIPYDDVPTKDRDENGVPTKRFIAKRCRHGLNYRMQADRLATVTSLDLREATSAYLIYHRINPQLQKWWNWQIENIRSTKQINNAFGRRLTLLGRADDDLMDSIIAYYPQSTAGDHVASVIYRAHSDVDWPTQQARTILNIHDALVALCKIEVRDKIARIYKKYAEAPIPILGIDGVTRNLIVPADFGYSEPDEHGVHRWSTIKKVKI